jgi:hypothetical protein
MNIQDYLIGGRYDSYTFINFIFSNIIYTPPTVKQVSEEKSIHLCLPKIVV